MFGCLTLRVGVTLVTVFYMVAGFGAFVLTLRELTSMVKVTQEHTLQSSCQFHGCHHHPFEMVTCDNLNDATFEGQGLLIIAGFVAGVFGYNGMVQRDSTLMYTFYYFLLGQYIVFVLSFLADNAYVEFCGRYPLTYWRLLQSMLPHRLALIELMGLDPHALPPPVLDELVGIPTMMYLRLITLVPIVLQLYVLLQVKKQCQIIGEGPVGMGALYGIDFATEEYSTFLDIGTGIREGMKDVVKPDRFGRHFPIDNLQRGGGDYPTTMVNDQSIGYKPRVGWCTKNHYENPHHEKMYGTFPETHQRSAP